jgi:peptidyl-prolyl cis-trans isomerase SurA
MGGCGGAEKAAGDAGAVLTSSDQTLMGDLPEALQQILRGLKVGESTPPFGSRADGVRVLVLCGRDDPAPRTPSFEEVHAQMSEARVGMMARRYLRDLRRDAIVDYR